MDTLEVKLNEETGEISIKNPVYSKTVIANTILMILSSISLVDPTLLNIDPRVLLLISGGLNIMLRFATSERIGFTPNKETSL